LHSQDSATLSPMTGYKKILMPHDGSEMSDKALKHAVYIAEVSGAELVILNVIETEVMPPSFTLAFLEPGSSLEQAREKLRNRMEGGVKQMLEQRVQRSKEIVGNDARISYVVAAGKPVDEITKTAEEGNYDLLIMGSSRITSPVRILGSTVRKVLDSVRKPVMVIHE
jgi:nucleotide-binding universal stress UspA family protein